MCMILDNNKWGDFLKQTEDMIPIHNWLKQKNGKLVYSNHQGFKELSTKYQKSLKEHMRAGTAKLVFSTKVEKEIEKLKKVHKLKSNDSHILGLAVASNTIVLCTGDKKLHKDFKDIIGGNIYQTEEHKNLLTKDLCP